MVSRRRLEQLLEQVLQGRGLLTFQEFESLIEALGFSLNRQRGSHRIYIHPKLDRPFPVQPDGKDAKRYQVRELRDMIRKFRLTFDANE
ncbi:MAG: type II toxin-antitoxin system HicA family toxin [Hyphomicrobiales bacterium]|nr:type II toxin-antitoxin system HicA family toxin [Hyphomicrobiales bacterium]